MSYIPIESTKVYMLACEVADDIYVAVLAWQNLATGTVGMQLVRSADSIAANLVEGDARRSDRDSARFFDYSGASGRETLHWTRVAYRRKLITQEQQDHWISRLDEVGRMINGLTQYRRRLASSTVRETLRAYNAEEELPLNPTIDPNLPI